MEVMGRARATDVDSRFLGIVGLSDRWGRGRVLRRHRDAGCVTPCKFRVDIVSERGGGGMGKWASEGVGRMSEYRVS